MTQPPVLIGYFPKRVVPRPDWLKAPGVLVIRSVSECMSSGPPDRIERWTHNEMWVYSTVAAARQTVPAGERASFEMQAYLILPVRWDDGVEEPLALPPLEAEPVPADFERVGFDVVSIMRGHSGFGCSPLSCNGMAAEIATNRHCLLDDLDVATRTAEGFSRGDVEPGPYHVVEVLRQAPPPTPARDRGSVRS